MKKNILMPPVLEKKVNTGFHFYGNWLNADNPFFFNHYHDVVELLYFTDGKTLISLDHDEYIAEKGDLLLIRSYTPHYLCCYDNNPCKHFILQISPHFILSQTASLNGASWLLRLSFNENNKKSLWKKSEVEALGIDCLFLKLKKEYDESDEFSDLFCTAYACEIIAKLLRNIGRTNIEKNVGENVRQLIFDSTVFIQRNFAEDITAEVCAKNVSLSTSYFLRNFKLIIGNSFSEYLNRVRIINANNLLISSDKSITEIASLCGFNSTSYFISTYKKIQKCTPLSYRKKHT